MLLKVIKIAQIKCSSLFRYFGAPKILYAVHTFVELPCDRDYLLRKPNTNAIKIDTRENPTANDFLNFRGGGRFNPTGRLAPPYSIYIVKLFVVNW